MATAGIDGAAAAQVPMRAEPAGAPAPDLTARWGADCLYPGRGNVVPQVRRIAVLRANAVGDFVVALPALAALRRCYPSARICLIGRAWHAEFLRRRPSPVDDVFVLPESISLAAPPSDAGEDTAVLAALQDCRFDLALQLHGGGLFSNGFIRRLGARVSAGTQAPGAPGLDRTLPYRDLAPEVLRWLEVVALVGAHGCDIEPRLAVTPADREEAAAALATAGSRPVLVLQPGCADPRRAWPAPCFAAVGDHFAARGAAVVLNGTSSEGPRLTEVREAMHAPCANLAGVLSLGGLLGLLSGARLLVANDTGPAHLARAIDVPSVTLCLIGNLASYGPMSSRRHAVAVSWQVHCPRCGRLDVEGRCVHDDSFAASIAQEHVLALAELLWRGG